MIAGNKTIHDQLMYENSCVRQKYLQCSEVRVTTNDLCSDQLDAAEVDVDVHAYVRHGHVGKAKLLVLLFVKFLSHEVMEGGYVHSCTAHEFSQ